MPLIPALERQKQANLCGFKASLVYIVSSRTGSKATKRNSVLKKNKIKKERIVVHNIVIPSGKSNDISKFAGKWVHIHS